MTHQIESLHAVANGKPVYIPTNLDARALVTALSQMGQIIPTRVSAGVAKNDLRDCGHRFSIKETDAALVKADLSITDRIAVKTAMSRNDILEH